MNDSAKEFAALAFAHAALSANPSTLHAIARSLDKDASDVDRQAARLAARRLGAACRILVDEIDAGIEPERR